MDKLIKSVLFSIALVSAVVTSLSLAAFIKARLVFSYGSGGLDKIIPFAVFVSCLVVILAAIKKLSE